QVDRMAEDVNRQNRLDASACFPITQLVAVPATVLVQKFDDRSRVDLKVFHLGIDENGPRANIANSVRRSDECKRGYEHFVILLDSGKKQRDVQGRSAINSGNSVLTPDLL